MNFEFGTFGHRALEALFNGVYQGLILTGLLWAAYRAISFWNAATRHAVGLLVMLIIAALPLAHLGEAFWLEYRARQAAAAPFVSPGPRVEGLILEPAVFVAPSETPVPQTPRTFAVPLKVSWALVTLWLAIAAFRLGGVGRQCLALRRMKRESLPADPELRSRFDALRAELEVARPVKLGLTEEVRSPIAAGFRHPMVLLPEEAERETTARLDAVLRHELAHVRRRDDWTNLLQQAIQAAFFFHPCVRWLANRLTLEREIACDDHALASLANRRDYALLLTEFASRSARREWVAAPGVWSKQGQLKERIAMIMNSHRNASTRLARTSAGALTLGAALVALLAMQAGPRLALAEEADKAEDRPAFRFEGKAGEVESSSPKGESRAYTQKGNICARGI
jgi:beta-lactamase regulating signal transducer with metallopeptidase domain